MKWRFWKKKQQQQPKTVLQISAGTDYSLMPFKEFMKAVKAIERSVKDTKDAWWHSMFESKLEDENMDKLEYVKRMAECVGRMLDELSKMNTYLRKLVEDERSDC